MPNGQQAGWRVRRRRGQRNGSDVRAGIQLKRASDLIDQRLKSQSSSCSLVSWVGVVQNGLSLLGTIRKQRLTIFVIFVGDDGRCQQRRIDRSRTTDGE